MVGMSLSLTQSLRQELSLKQEIAHKLCQTQRLTLEIYIEIGDYFEGLYSKAEKRTYQKHGLDFEYAAIKVKDLSKKCWHGVLGLQYSNVMVLLERL